MEEMIQTYVHGEWKNCQHETLDELEADGWVLEGLEQVDGEQFAVMSRNGYINKFRSVNTEKQADDYNKSVRQHGGRAARLQQLERELEAITKAMERLNKKQPMNQEFKDKLSRDFDKLDRELRVVEAKILLERLKQ